MPAAPTAAPLEARGRSHPALGHRPGLDGVRALAVGLVLLHHVTFPDMTPSWLESGAPFIGVDVFFVLSGFLITRLLLDEVDQTDRIALGRFWARRALRLMPLAIAVVLAVVVVDAIDHDAFYREGADLPAWRSALAALGYHMNILQMIDSTKHVWALTHTWSLSIEEQFYVIWPAFLAFAVRGRRARAPMIVFVSSMVVVVLSAIVRFIEAERGHSAYVYNSLESRSGQLCAGAALAAATLLWPRAVAWIGRFGWPALAGIMVIGIHNVGNLPYSELYDEVTALTVVMVAAACAFGPSHGFAERLQLRPLRWLGQRSYAVYLVHYPVMLAFTRDATGLDTGPVIVLRLVLSLLLAEVAHRAIERPALALRRRHPIFNSPASPAPPAPAPR